MTSESIAKIIYDFVKRNGGISFVQIETLFDNNGFDYEGNLIVGTSIKNTIVWSGWNQLAIDAMNKAVEMGVRFTPTSALIYYMDGAAPLNLPIAKTTNGYKKEVHWLPVALNVPK